jgi:hypothetical protein
LRQASVRRARDNLGAKQFINASCFAPPSPGVNGDVVFQHLRGPAPINHGLSAFKNFGIDERRRFQFRSSA